MKVIIMGSHCVGKTTLINDIDDIFKHLVIPEQVRVIADTFKDFKHSQNATCTTQNLIFEQYLQELSIRSNYISDRGLLDVFAYTQLLCMHCKTDYDWRVYNYHIHKEDSIIRQFMIENPDVHYIYLPIEFDIEDDSFRDTDKEYRKAIDGRIQSLIMEYCKDSDIRMIQGTREERQDQLNTLLYEWTTIEH